MNDVLDLRAEQTEISKHFDNPNAKSYMSMMDDQTGRRPYLSTKGYTGLGPADVQAGDIICVYG
jgi:hypothetical protein